MIEPEQTPLTKRYHHGNLKQVVLQESLRIISEQGIEALNLREVARRIGVSQAAPYRHFKDKVALLVEIATEGYETLTQEMLQALRTGGVDPAQRLTHVLEAYITFAVQRGAHYRVMFGSEVANKHPYPELESSALACFGVLKMALEGALKLDNVTTREVREMAVFAWSMGHGLATLIINGHVTKGPIDDVTLKFLIKRQAGLLLASLPLK